MTRATAHLVIRVLEGVQPVVEEMQLSHSLRMKCERAPAHRVVDEEGPAGHLVLNRIDAVASDRNPFIEVFRPVAHEEDLV